VLVLVAFRPACVSLYAEPFLDLSDIDCSTILHLLIYSLRTGDFRCVVACMYSDGTLSLSHGNYSIIQDERQVI
jgi:hypothetical protein